MDTRAACSHRGAIKLTFWRLLSCVEKILVLAKAKHPKRHNSVCDVDYLGMIAGTKTH